MFILHIFKRSIFTALAGDKRGGRREKKTHPSPEGHSYPSLLLLLHTNIHPIWSSVTREKRKEKERKEREEERERVCVLRFLPI
jgi:hypothetical protein